MSKKNKTQEGLGVFGTPVFLFNFCIARTSSNQHPVVKEIDVFNKDSKDGRKGKSIECDADFTTKNFPEATNPIEIGESYDVYEVPILGKAMPADCLSYMIQKGYLIQGAQLIPIAAKRKKELTENKWYTSIDADVNCYKRGGEKVFPCLMADEGGVEVQLAIYRVELNSNFVLLCAVKK